MLVRIKQCKDNDEKESKCEGNFDEHIYHIYLSNLKYILAIYRTKMNVYLKTKVNHNSINGVYSYIELKNKRIRLISV